PPKWNIEPEGQVNIIGADVIIRCAAYGNPVPSVTWMVNGRSFSGMTPCDAKP
ncbi:neural cell adhesion molecule L1-like protein isoform X1, partial [Clarias magur]